MTGQALVLPTAPGDTVGLVSLAGSSRRSIPRSQGDPLLAYEGLVHSTARRFAAEANMDEDDFAQELRIKIWRAREKFDPSRSRMTEKSFVFALMFNRVKDLLRYKKDQQLLIEDLAPAATTSSGEAPTRDRFENRYFSSPHEEVFKDAEDSVAIPAGLSPFQEQVLFLLYLDYTQKEIAPYLDVPLHRVKEAARLIREKLEAWRPETAATVVHLDVTKVLSEAA